jgi:hypothetical protein
MVIIIFLLSCVPAIHYVTRHKKIVFHALLLFSRPEETDNPVKSVKTFQYIRYRKYGRLLVNSRRGHYVPTESGLVH